MGTRLDQLTPACDVILRVHADFIRLDFARVIPPALQEELSDEFNGTPGFCFGYGNASGGVIQKQANSNPISPVAGFPPNYHPQDVANTIAAICEGHRLSYQIEVAAAGETRIIEFNAALKLQAERRQALGIQS